MFVAYTWILNYIYIYMYVLYRCVHIPKCTPNAAECRRAAETRRAQGGSRRARVLYGVHGVYGMIQVRKLSASQKIEEGQSQAQYARAAGKYLGWCVVGVGQVLGVHIARHILSIILTNSFVIHFANYCFVAAIHSLKTWKYAIKHENQITWCLAFLRTYTQRIATEHTAQWHNDGYDWL